MKRKWTGMLLIAAVITLNSGGAALAAPTDSAPSEHGSGAAMHVLEAGEITTVAGNGTYGYAGDGGPAVASQLWGPGAIAFDKSGKLYIADILNNCIRKVDANGTITTAAGNGKAGFSGDGGAAAKAQLNAPAAIALDAAGNLFIADVNNYRIRKVDAKGVITTFAGNGTAGYSGDGKAAVAAKLWGACSVSLDKSGNLYIAESQNNVVRKVDVKGIISTVAGNGTAGFSGDGGAAKAAKLNGPGGVLADSSGNLYVADTDNLRIRKIDGKGIISTLSGTGVPGFSGDGGSAKAAKLSSVYGLALDGYGCLYAADSGNSRIRKIDSKGIITTAVGIGTAGYAGDGGASGLAKLNNPRGVWVDGAGNLYISDRGNHCIRKVKAMASVGYVAPPVTKSSLVITTFAGMGNTGYRGDGGLSKDAELWNPGGACMDSKGALLIADTGNHCLRRIDSRGIITTIAGTGSRGYSGDGSPAKRALMDSPTGISVDKAGNIYVADTGNNCIRKIDARGIITTLAGDWNAEYLGDGLPGKSARLNGPRGVCADGAGNLYIADTNNHCIRKLDKAGIITTVVGNGKEGFAGDGGTAKRALLRGPSAVMLDGTGNLYIADTGNQQIRKVDSKGIITTVAGKGTAGYSGDGGAAAAAELNGPVAISQDRSGNLLIADSNNNRIRKIDGKGVITSVAGNGSKGFSGDGSAASSAMLGSPQSIAVDSGGNLFIADKENCRIRKVSTVLEIVKN